MKILFDQGVPVPLRDSVPAEVVTCYEMGWATLSNGKLIVQAEKEFDVFVTTDKNPSLSARFSRTKNCYFRATYNPLAIAQSTCNCYR